MDSRISDAGRFTRGIAIRAVIVGACACVAVQLFASTHLYATAVFLTGLAVLVAVDMRSVISKVVRASERDLARLAVEGSDVPLPPSVRDRLAFTADRTAAVLNAARAERLRQMDFLQSLLDTVSAALFVVAPDGKVRLVNRAALSLAATAAPDFAAIPRFGMPVAQKLLALAPGAREVLTLADGQRVLASAARFSAPGHDLHRLISLQRITGELDAVELKAWQDMANVLAHEMMNSLTPIASLSESLEELLHPNEEASGAVEVIKRRSRGLMDFVERYRAIAELPAPRPQRVRMARFLSDIDRLLAATFIEKSITCRASVEPVDTTVMADPQLLEQAVINLLRNATDAVRDTRPARVDVACRIYEGVVSIEIADNGCGVPEANRDQVFVPFFTTKAGGSGIGLNLARQIALAHGGQLAFRANKPQGSVFTLTLPSHQSSADPSADPPPKEYRTPTQAPMGAPGPRNCSDTGSSPTAGPNV
jgi:two-component system, NtrC family, nitrogen regulation sensor histidine kinase NtrY